MKAARLCDMHRIVGMREGGFSFLVCVRDFKVQIFTAWIMLCFVVLLNDNCRYHFNTTLRSE